MVKIAMFVVALVVALFVHNSEQVLQIHAVPHSHDDVGWLKTVDEYYYGANMSIQNAGVQYTIDNVIYALQQDPARKFIYVEMAFFFRWWREQTPAMQSIVKDLVRSGQLEFINGGWTMHDEACVHFEDMVSQMTLGHQFLYDTFAVTPKVAWQIDPFGHSATSAVLDNLIGFEALFFARLDYQDVAKRLGDKGIEMNWYPSQSDPSIELLTGLMYSGYCLTGFNFEYGDDPIMDDPNLENYNLVEKADELVAHAFEQSSFLRHNNVMFPWGCDFQYINAHMNYKNIDKLMKYINNNTDKYNVSIFYSTPSIYAEAIKKENPTLLDKYEDFMPYADCPHCYWSGYFTSRAAFKGMVRYSSHILSAVSSLLATSQVRSQELMDTLFLVQQPNGVATHHDSVTGTEKQHVTDDYALNLDKGNSYAFDMMSQILGQLSGNSKPPQFTFCPLLNQSICEISSTWSSGVLPVVVYNPLGWDRVENVRIPVGIAKVSVTDSNGNAIPAQVVPGPYGIYNLTFQATVSALGYQTYFVQLATSTPAEFVEPQSVSEAFVIENKYLSVSFDASGNIESVNNKVTGATTPIQQQYFYYVGSQGDSLSGQASGAYIFRPTTQAANMYPSKPSSVTLANGTVVAEVVRVFSAQISQIVRLYATDDFIEIVDVVGPIDISDGNGKEVITRYTTQFASNGTWFSDSNGVEMMKRIRNFRPDWDYQITEPTAGNYVPVDAITYIRDETANQQLTVLTDRSRSSASLADGQLETMLHRRLLHDDGRGVAEALNETTTISTSELLVFSNATSAASCYRPLAKRHYHPLVVGFSSASSVSAWTSANKPTWSPMTALPANVQLLSFVPIPSGGYILRLHHIFQVDEDATLSLPVTVDISALFPGLTVSSAKEMQLTGVQAVSRVDAVHYTARAGAKLQAAAIPVQLNPTEIRTFIVNFAAASPLGTVSIV